MEVRAREVDVVVSFAQSTASFDDFVAGFVLQLCTDVLASNTHEEWSIVDDDSTRANRTRHQ